MPVPDTTNPNATSKKPTAHRPSKDKQIPLQPLSKEKQNRPRHSDPPPVTQTKKEQRAASSSNVEPRPPRDPHQSQTKRIARRSSKPIIDWFQRKLAGSVRTRRASDATRGSIAKDKQRPPLPESFSQLSRVHSTPSRGRSSGDKEIRRSSQIVDGRQGIISLNDGPDLELTEAEVRGEASTYRSSLARDSMWSPTSNLEADEDASVRPLPPSAPPSPSPSRSSSSYLSDPRTFRSMAASTKPTTLLSVDLTGGMAHIAQAPPTPVSAAHRLAAHVRSNSGTPGSIGGSISFSALPPSPSSSRPSSVQNSLNPTQALAVAHSLQAPQHTAHHPRNNPRPSSPPSDDASVLTLASSAFGIPGARAGAMMGGDSTSISHISHMGGSRFLAEDRSSHFVLGDDPDVEGERDVDASVRALRPRSSRRGSWESEASGWSAAVLNGSTAGIMPGTPSLLRDRSMWTGSVRTGGQFSAENGDGEDDSIMASPSPAKEDGAGSYSENKSVAAVDGEHSSSVAENRISQADSVATVPQPNHVAEPEPSPDASPAGPGHEEQQDSGASPNHEQPNASDSTEESSGQDVQCLNEKIAETGSEKVTSPLSDVWHSAPSTPMF
ncbi:hypothetical protein DENSPDRAFT_830868 [Dentipellis sp. KUC8613]|nr:hypothetical protein DENSPDRAFT_830868 [Dentipellis sp. KUC8613]